MALRDITMSDLPLYEALLVDPATMADLGGPLPREILGDKLRGIVDDVQAGSVWYSVIESDAEPVGTVCIWDSEDEGQTISEIGWMVLPAFQGRGLASTAVASILDRARAERRWGVIHAHPGIANGASNAICRKMGFELVQERDIEYMGRTLRCNHWMLDLRAQT